MTTLIAMAASGAVIIACLACGARALARPAPHENTKGNE